MTASAVEQVPEIIVKEISVGDEQRADFPILCHSFPEDITVDGFLGLDFIRGTQLTIDFRGGLVKID
jgi:hypothetical protein